MKRREIIYNKFGGKCAYTGKPLDEKWQIDHITPKAFEGWYYSEISRKAMNCKGDDINSIENLLPALRIVNHYKRAFDLEGFRQYMLTFHLRVAKLPRNPRIEKSKKRKEYMLQVADAFGITSENPFDGIFYFEKEIKTE